MWLPMAILAIGSVTSGFLLSRGETLKRWLEPLFEEHGEHTELLPPIVVSGLALLMVAVGVALAIVKYQLSEVDAVAPTNVTEFTQFARRDLFQDEINEALFMRPGQVITSALVKVDKRVIDGAVHGIGKMALGSSSYLRKSQTGFVRSYAVLILIGAAALIAAIWVVTQ
jgi:NADH-quinone oxidoreductase subunit L